MRIALMEAGILGRGVQAWVVSKVLLFWETGEKQGFAGSCAGAKSLGGMQGRVHVALV